MAIQAIHKYFYPRSPCGERPRTGLTCGGGRNISIHALLAESDGTGHTGQQSAVYFYPRSPCGERRQQPDGTTRTTYFYPRSPCGERQPDRSAPDRIPAFLSTLSLRRATRPIQARASRNLISIHALLAESDSQPMKDLKADFISIHALLAESDPAAQGIGRGADHFYPRSPCGERHAKQGAFTAHHAFLSTLSLRRATT